MRARAASAPRPLAAEHFPEDIAEDVAEILRVRKRIAAAARRADPSMPISVVGGALFRVAQDLVGL